MFIVWNSEAPDISCRQDPSSASGISILVFASHQSLEDVFSKTEIKELGFELGGKGALRDFGNV